MLGDHVAQIKDVRCEDLRATAPSGETHGSPDFVVIWERPPRVPYYAYIEQLQAGDAHIFVDVAKLALFAEVKESRFNFCSQKAVAGSRDPAPFKMSTSAPSASILIKSIVGTPS